MGTGGGGIGATIRQPSLSTSAGTCAGRTVAGPSTALEIKATLVGLDWLDLSRSDKAQQLSACAWLTERCCSLRDSPWCMGHGPSAEQHSMRASGVGAQPAQSAALPAETKTASRRATRRLVAVNTPVRMLNRRVAVK